MLSCTLGVLGAYPAARADPRVETASVEARSSARALADEAANAFARAEYRRAHELLIEAYRLVPAPTIAVLDARSLIELGRWVEARQAYLRALAEPRAAHAPPAFRRAVEEAHAGLGALDARLPRLSIIVPSGNRDALVRVVLDGEAVPLDRLGTELELDPTAHALHAEFRAEDGEGGVTRITRSVVLAAGERRTVVLERPAPSGNAARTWGFVSFGAGASGIVVGLVAGGIALNARDDAARRCPERSCVAGSDGAAALDRFRTYRAISTVGYAVGFVGAGVGAALLLSAPQREPQRARERARERNKVLAIAPTWNGLELRGEL